MMNNRQIRRTFRVNQANNLVLRIQNQPPLELLLDSKCPKCGVALAPHGEGNCSFFEKLTFQELADSGYARWVEQV